MSFGIKKPYSFTRVGYITDSYKGLCQGCDKIATDTQSVAPANFPDKESSLYNVKVQLLCSTCYNIQNRLNYPTVEDFRNRSGGASCESPGRISKIFKSATGLTAESVILSKLSELVKLNKLILKRLNRMSESNILIESECDVLDDIEFGMTEAQKLSMDEAVKQSAARMADVL